MRGRGAAPAKMVGMLEVLGVSADDERIYRSLLRQPGISAVELGRAVGRTRTRSGWPWTGSRAWAW